MYSPEKVQQAVEEITAALGERQLREKSIYQYRLHYQEFIAYIKTKGLVSVDESTLLEFLRHQYDVHISNLHARGFDYIVGGHIRPFAILNWYLVTGEIDSRARVRTPPFMCPEDFCDSYNAFLDYLEEKGLSHYTIHNYRETVQQMIRHMTADGIESTDMISPAGILSFLNAFEHFSNNRLKLKDIDWKNHKVRIITAKNGQELELPLLENTGWAIIDYLQICVEKFPVQAYSKPYRPSKGVWLEILAARAGPPKV